jgi:hypothetical protein
LISELGAKAAKSGDFIANQHCSSPIGASIPCHRTAGTSRFNWRLEKEKGAAVAIRIESFSGQPPINGT